jgi:hypothetical protein
MHRTTVRLPDEVLEEAKQYALDHGSTLTEVFEEALREHLARRRQRSGARRRVKLPTFGGRGPRPGVDLHDSADLRERMDEDDRS